MTLLAIASVLQLSTAVTAAVLCFRRRPYRAVALLFVVVALADWLRLWIDKLVLADVATPYTGTARGVYPTPNRTRRARIGRSTIFTNVSQRC